MAANPWAAGGIYHDYVGWTSVYGYTGQVVYIRRKWATAVELASVAITFEFSDPPASGNGFMVSPNINPNPFTGVSGGTVTRYATGTQLATEIQVAIGDGGNNVRQARITAITVEGNGTNPLLNETPIGGDWFHTFDFTRSDGGWEATPSQPGGNWVCGSGWTSVSGYGGQVVYIRRAWDTAVELTSIDMTIAFSGTPAGANGYIQAENINRNFSGGGSQTVVATAAGSDESDEIRVAIGNGGGSVQGRITSITVRGTGVNPFLSEETEHKTALDDAFAAIHDALHTNPSANITTLVTAYKDEIESAFGVTFDKQPSSDAKDWESNLLSLHFARQGLEATAQAFERWVEAQILDQSLCKSVDRYALFQRIMGSLTLKNMPETRINIAEVDGHTIKVYQRPTEINGYKECIQMNGTQEIILGQVLKDDPCPTGTEFSRQAYNRDGNNVLIDTDRQGIMTPNNVIHELGHSLDGFTGFGVKKIGSIQEAIDNTSLGGGTALHDGYSRDGMGEEHLRVQYYEHAHITNNNGVAEFDPFVPPSGFDQSGYLQYDLFNTYYSLWNSDYNIYRVINMNARIDTFAINPAQSPEETVADAFLSWVRGDDGFQSDTAGQNWKEFFADSIGIFLRNAAIYHIGMVQHYQSIGLIPLSPIVISTNFATNYFLRLAPQEVDATILGASSGLSSNVPIYGWLDAGGTLGDGVSTYWLLVADGLNRLLWIAAGGVAHTESQVKAQSAVSSGTLAQLNPTRAYSDIDLLTIIGS